MTETPSKHAVEEGLAFAPRFTWTCPGATAALVVAVTPNSEATLAPLFAAPVP